MICKVCGQDKDISCFYKCDKHHCKECKKKYAKVYRERNYERILAYDRNRPNAKERCEKQKEYKAKMRIENPLKFDKTFHSIRKRYREKYPEKLKANNKLNDAIRNGKIIRPNECSVCKTPCVPHGHHFDYSKPLDVIWVCSQCHSKIHKQKRLSKLFSGKIEKVVNDESTEN